MRKLIIDGTMTLVAVAGLALPVSGQISRSRTPVTTETNVRETNVRAAKTPYTAE